MLTSAVYVDVKVQVIDRYSIHVYAMEVFDSFMMIGKIVFLNKYKQLLFFFFFSSE